MHLLKEEEEEEEEEEGTFLWKSYSSDTCVDRSIIYIVLVRHAWDSA
jgi:hypothetical protein